MQNSISRHNLDGEYGLSAIANTNSILNRYINYGRRKKNCLFIIAATNGINSGINDGKRYQCSLSHSTEYFAWFFQQNFLQEHLSEGFFLVFDFTLRKVYIYQNGINQFPIKQCLNHIFKKNKEIKNDIRYTISYIRCDFDDRLHFAYGHTVDRSWISKTTIQWQHLWKTIRQQHWYIILFLFNN